MILIPVLVLTWAPVLGIADVSVILEAYRVVLPNLDEIVKYKPAKVLLKPNPTLLSLILNPVAKILFMHFMLYGQVKV